MTINYSNLLTAISIVNVGAQMVGEIIEVGTAVTEFSVGAKVSGDSDTGGCFAEEAVVSVKVCIISMDHLTFTH